MTWRSFVVISKFGGHVHTKLGNVLSPSISTVVHLNFDTGRKDDLENNTRRRDGPSPTFVHCDFGPRRRDNPRSIDFDAMRRSCVKKRTDDATGRQWGSVRATAVRRDAVLAGDLKGLDYYVILI